MASEGCEDGEEAKQDGGPAGEVLTEEVEDVHTHGVGEAQTEKKQHTYGDNRDEPGSEPAIAALSSV